ncbi:hypothetical protein K402DRAFT_406448 [Aulographum hederae CBS 113979]|uniref:Uncharacterized protein n=1 Tax=Aulographum hederae CBS 113979 TaxID=1176131 RepID=A0A6G1GTB3_9PEZI|nr:hypothetical protein K402DRAFT_406448 [Aulographum hederae CBS 113979]
MPRGKTAFEIMSRPPFYASQETLDESFDMPFADLSISMKRELNDFAKQENNAGRNTSWKDAFAKIQNYQLVRRNGRKQARGVDSSAKWQPADVRQAAQEMQEESMCKDSPGTSSRNSRESQDDVSPAAEPLAPQTEEVLSLFTSLLEESSDAPLTVESYPDPRKRRRLGTFDSASLPPVPPTEGPTEGPIVVIQSKAKPADTIGSDFAPSTSHVASPRNSLTIVERNTSTHPTAATDQVSQSSDAESLEACLDPGQRLNEACIIQLLKFLTTSTHLVTSFKDLPLDPSKWKDVKLEPLRSKEHDNAQPVRTTFSKSSSAASSKNGSASLGMKAGTSSWRISRSSALRRKLPLVALEDEDIGDTRKRKSKSQTVHSHDESGDDRSTRRKRSSADDAVEVVKAVKELKEITQDRTCLAHEDVEQLKREVEVLVSLHDACVEAHTQFDNTSSLAVSNVGKCIQLFSEAHESCARMLAEEEKVAAHDAQRKKNCVMLETCARRLAEKTWVAALHASIDVD